VFKCVCGNGLSWLFNGLRVCGSGALGVGWNRCDSEWHWLEVFRVSVVGWLLSMVWDGCY